MSEEATNEQPVETPAPETVSRGAAGDQTPPKLGKADWFAQAQAKLKEVTQAAADEGNLTAPQEPAAGAEGAPQEAAKTPAEPDAPDPLADLADRLVRGEQAAPEPEPEPAIDAEDPRLAQSLAKLIELEQTNRAEHQKMVEQQQALAAERQKLAKLAKANEILESGGSKLDVLQHLGLSYEELTAEVMGGGSQPAAKLLGPLHEQIAELQRKLEEQPKEYEAKLEEMQRKQLDAQVQQWRTQAAGTLKSDGERWGLLTSPTVTHGRDPVDLTVDLMQAAAQRGEHLTFEQAADRLEMSFERRAREEGLDPNSKLGKILRLTALAPTAPSTETPAPTVPGSSDGPTSRTPISPDLASRSTAKPDDGQQLTRDDYKRRAQEAMRRLGEG